MTLKGRRKSARKQATRKARVSRAPAAKASAPKAAHPSRKAAVEPGRASRVRAVRPRGGVRWGRVALVIALLVALGPPAWVALYRVAPPPITALMLERWAQGQGQGQGLHKHWTPLADISPELVRSVIASEDAHFCDHHGFDLSAMRAAAAHNARSPGKVRGGSTISQQTAKNVFLWPQRSYLRKGLEAYFTVLTEALWGKRRIMETYLNVVEWGPGVYGAQAASQRYFGHDADALTAGEAARLAAILPDPLKWKAVRPGRYVVRRSRRIGAGARTVEADDLAACVLKGG